MIVYNGRVTEEVPNRQENFFRKPGTRVDINKGEKEGPSHEEATEANHAEGQKDAKNVRGSQECRPMLIINN